VPTSLTRRIVEEADDDNMEEIDTDNIITTGRRTRGKVIDFAKAAENTKDLEEDEEDDDEDFEAPDEEMEG
jgi:Histone chaperone domain CHZ